MGEGTHEKKRVPAIRFAGFTEPWEQRKLENLAVFNPKENLPDEFEYVDLESVVETEMLSHRTEKKATAPSRAQRLARLGDVFYQTVRPYQKNNYLFEKTDKYYVFSTGYAQLRPYNDGYFLFSLVQCESFVKVVLDHCTGTSYPAINSNDLAKINVFAPINAHEHKKIGKIFRNLDNLITLHQRKCDALKKVKKSLLQKMFPKEGSVVPEIRFAGFTEAWEQRKLGNLAQFSKGIGYSKSDLKSKGTPIILYGRLYTKYETIISNVDTYVEPKENSVYSQGGEVIVPASGETSDEISIASVVEKSGVLLGGDLNIITPSKNLDPAFLAISISNGKPHKDMTKMAQGKSVVHLHNTDLEKIKLLYPEFIEQQKISHYFRKFDNLITLHQRKLDQLKTIKKSLLQQMFV